MKKLALAYAAIAAVIALTASTAADAHTWRRHHVRYVHHTYSGCEADRHSSANRGTIIGAVAGGVIGNEMAGSGSRGLGTVLGAGGGAVVGHQIGKSSHHC